MSTIIIGAIVTLALFIIIALIFRNRGSQGDNSGPGYFSTYDGGHDGLGERGGDWGGREGSHDGGSYDGGSGGDGGGADGDGGGE